MSAIATTARLLWPASDMQLTTVQIGSGVTSVVAAAYSGLEILGTVGGALGGIAAVVALVLSVAAGNAKRRRQYDDDIRGAETRGEVRLQGRVVDLEHDVDNLRRDRDEWRERYLDLLEGRRAQHRGEHD